MPHPVLSTHARTRMQQRGVGPGVLDLLLDYGATTHDHRGAEVLFFDKAARRRLLRAAGRATYQAVEGKLDAYAVVAGDGAVITVGRRGRRLWRG